VNFAIRYLTTYDYDVDVVDNLNALRVKPAGNSRQRCDEFTVRLNPEVRLHRHSDYFGTEVVEFEVSRPHRRLTIDVRARVTTAAAPEPPQAPWDALAERSYREAGGEFLLQTDDAPGHAVLGEMVTATRAAFSPLAAVLLTSELIPDRFEYRKGATYVDSPIEDLLDAGAGVCQDFVHLGLSLLRHHGIAARYVSGYLFAVSDTDPAHPEESIEVDTHAWIEALLPVPDGGEPVWVGVDPTNRGLAGENHVKIGHGRHYADVPPTKGVYRGQAEAALDAHVTMTRLERGDPASIARA
jgi:transglutaminase-like putative cysteine protease